jgi:lipid-A-disaccharide synthase
MNELFLFAGEPSADLCGAELILALKKQKPNLTIFGVGGPHMRKAGLNCIIPMEKFLVMGFVDVFFALPRIARLFFSLRSTILKERPKVALFIDYPGFNLRMEKSLRKKGFKGKLCHYICPSVWAWGKKRIPQMARTLDLLLCILPFEPALFADTPLRALFIGHPLIERLKHHPYKKERLFPADKRVVALFAGSRHKEIRRNLPLHLLVAKELSELYDNLLFAISLPHPRFEEFIRAEIKKHHLEKQCELVPQEDSYDLMKECEMAIAKSGTVTLELALHCAPTVVTYAISPLDLFIAKDLLRIRLPHYSLANITAGRTLFPELIGPNFTREHLLNACHYFLKSEDAREECRRGCNETITRLKEKSASATAAKTLCEFL